MAGLGNIYRTEVCFLHGVSPWTPVRDVPDLPAVVELARTLLLRNADRPEQSTTGELQRGRRHWVYGRGGQPCRRCGTPVRTAAQTGAGETADPVEARISFWCPRCQPGPSP